MDKATSWTVFVLGGIAVIALPSDVVFSDVFFVDSVIGWKREKRQLFEGKQGQQYNEET